MKGGPENTKHDGESGLRDVTGDAVADDPFEETVKPSESGPELRPRGARLTGEAGFKGVKGDWADNPLVKTLAFTGCAWAVWPIIAVALGIVVIVIYLGGWRLLIWPAIMLVLIVFLYRLLND
jgi:hypothetical protein